MNAIRLLLVDARPLIRAALGCLLGGRSEFRLVGEAASLAQAQALAAEHAPDVILVVPRTDTDLGIDGIPRLLAAAGSHARVLLVADAADADLHRLAVRQGAHGCVGTDRPPETLFKAIEKVFQGEVWMERRLMADILSGHDPAAVAERTRIDSLTRREREVVGLVCQGLRNKQIAERLTVTDVTVRHHLTSVFAKLGVNDRLGLLIYANRNGLAPTHESPYRHS